MYSNNTELYNNNVKLITTNRNSYREIVFTRKLRNNKKWEEGRKKRITESKGL